VTETGIVAKCQNLEGRFETKKRKIKQKLTKVAALEGEMKRKNRNKTIQRGRTERLGRRKA
jgi:hypothetical protein